MLENKKLEYIKELEQRVEDKIMNEANAKFLEKLINKADSLEEVQAIMAMGTTYKRTGFHFDFRKEKDNDNIKYLKKNEKLSFVTNKSALTHKLIIGDNYDALRQLLITHRGKIDVIYIDPPYGKDSMGNFAKTNYTNEITRDNLLSMLYVRLQLARDLLSEDGVIFCSIDDKNQAYVKCLFDEVFGEQNFISNIIWQSSGGSNTGEKMVTVTEYVLLYSKSKDYYLKLGERDFSNFTLVDEYVEERGKYCLQKLDGTFTSNHYSSSLYYPIIYKGKEIWPGGERNDNNLWNWRWSKDKVEWGIKNDFITFIEDGERVKVYFKNYVKVDNKNQPRKPSVTLKNVFIGTDTCTTSTGTMQLKEIFIKSPFEFPKSTKFIKYLFNLIDVFENAIFLDFFAGSGTSGQAVLELNKEDGGNRQFILCTNNEITDMNSNGIAYDVTSKRLKRVMTGSCYDGTNNFKWLENNEPYGDNLEVTEIMEVSPTAVKSGETAFDLIDESLYDIIPFENIEDKIDWVCKNFKRTMKSVESDKDYINRWGE